MKMLQTDINKNSSSNSAVNINDDDSTRRRSTFYVPLTITSDRNDESLVENHHVKKSLDRIYNPDLSNGSLDWSLNSSLNSTGDLLVSSEKKNKLKRYGIVLNGSINIDDSIEIPQPSNNVSTDSQRTHTSTPISLMKARSRINILSLPDKTMPPSPAKEKSKTLPQNLTSPTSSNTFPPKSSFLLKSTPKILSHLNYSSSENFVSPSSPRSSLSPKKSLSFVRRTHSTKLSRSNSLLKSFSSQQRYSSEQDRYNRIEIIPLPKECLEQCFDSGNFEESVKQMFFVEQKPKEKEEDDDVKHQKDKSCTKYDNYDDDDSDPHSGNYYLRLISLRTFFLTHTR